jgi:hypothetical protein
MQEKPMRQVTDHKIEGVDNQLDIAVLDEPGAGGANHVYQITAIVPHIQNMESVDDFGLPQIVKTVDLGTKLEVFCDVKFQNGAIQEAGLNGITQEVLIAICVTTLTANATHVAGASNLAIRVC